MLKPPPAEPLLWYGVTTYSDHEGRFKFWVPSNWHREDLKDERDGAIWMPDPEDPDTHLSCWIQKLEQRITEDDRDDLRSGIEQGLSQLPKCDVESGSDDNYGDLIKFERIFTYGDPSGELRRKRRSWYLYADEWAIVLAWQGATPEHYEYWLPMGNYAFATFDVAEWLWFATDRDLGFRP